MQNSLCRKGLIVGMLCLFFGASVVSGFQINSSSQPLSRGNWLYVGGSGSGNYTRIQDAIIASSDGDTIFVYTGIYYEHLNVNKSITLIGEDKNTTIIDGEREKDLIVNIFADWVNISGFTIQNSGFDYPYHDAGIQIYDSCHICVSDNIFKDNDIALWLLNLSFIHILNNIIENNSKRGSFVIWFRTSCDNITIAQNIISDNYGDMTIFAGGAGDPTSDFIISDNTFERNNGSAIDCNYVKNGICSGNVVKENLFSGIIFGGENLIISRNIVMNNSWFDGGVGIASEGKNITITNNYIARHRNLDPYQSRGSLGIEGRILNGNISYNTIIDNDIGVYLSSCTNATLYMNNVTNNTVGIEIYNPSSGNMSHCMNGRSLSSVVKQNNFEKNRFQIKRTYLGSYRNTQWENNYWGRARLLPKFIIVFRKITPMILIPSRLEFDRHPAQKPYTIPKGGV